MGRHTTFRFCLDPTASQAVGLARHAGAARFGFNQCLRLHLDARHAWRRDPAARVPWSGFDLINAFNGWKKTAAAGRVIAVDACGRAEVVSVGLAWRGQVCQQVFEEAAVDLGRALRAWTDSRRGRRAGRRVGHPRWKKKTRSTPAFRLRSRPSPAGGASIRIGQTRPRSITLPKIGPVRVREDTRRLRRVQTHDRLVIEDLNIAGMLANHHLARSISDAGWAELARQLDYKQTWRGGQVRRADRWYPSSQLCSRCGCRRRGLTLAERIYRCAECGLVIDRDLNAAANLAAWADLDPVHDDARDDRSWVRDPQAAGPVTNAHRQHRADHHPVVAKRAG